MIRRPTSLSRLPADTLDLLPSERREEVEGLYAQARAAQLEAGRAERRYRKLAKQARATAVRWENEVLEVNGQGTLISREEGL